MKKKTYRRKKKVTQKKNILHEWSDRKSITGFLIGILFTLLITSLPHIPTYIQSTGIINYYKNFFTPVALAAYDKKFLTEIGSTLPDDGENSLQGFSPSPFSSGETNQAGQLILHGSRDKKEIALTFDADMTEGMKNMLESGEVSSYYDSHLVSLLNQTHTKATVFVTGLWIELYPDVAKELAANPLFELANHSYSHPSFSGYCYGLPQVPASELSDQVVKTQQLLKTVADVDNYYFRFPGGCYSEENLNLMKQLGMTVIHWDVVAEDGFNDNTQAIENNVLSNVQNGSIIVMHFNGPPNEPSTEAALEVIIPQLKKRGFEFVKVSELLQQNTQNQAVDIKNYLHTLEGV